MEKIYLDHNCYQRGFDDHTQLRIKLEALACQGIFDYAENNKVELIWSFMNEDETRLCPFPERNYEVLKLSELCNVKVEIKDEIVKKAKNMQKQSNLTSKDALHLACAWYCKADYFLTCDDKLIKAAQKLKLGVRIMNPVDYLRKEDI